MINKIVATAAAALDGIRDGSTIMVGGFGSVGQPDMLIEALVEQGARDLTIVANNAGSGHVGLAKLLGAGRVSRIICSFPRSAGSLVFEELFRAGRLQLEIVPQGTLAERIRAAGAGVAAFWTPTGYGTRIAENKETRIFDGKGHVMEYALHADAALVETWQADRWGNCTYRKSGRNFNAVMATAATLTVVQARQVVPLGAIDPEAVVTPGIYVDRVIQHGEAR